MLARGRQSPLSRKSGTVRLTLCARMMRAMGNPSARAQTRGEGVAEIARWNDVGRLGAGAPLDIETGGGVVHHLRQQPADIDAVGGTEAVPAGSSAESRNASFTKRWQSSKVPSMRSDDTLSPQQVKLLLLPRTHQSLGIQNDHPHPGTPVKGRRHGAAGVPGGRHQDRQRLRRVPVSRRCRLSARKRAPKSLKAAVGP